MKARGVLPYMGYIGMCGLKEYGFSAVLVINRISILTDFGQLGHKYSRFWFLYSSLDMGMFFKRPLFLRYRKENQP